MSLPKNIYILRHGQSLGNADWRVYQKMSDEDIPLTNTGKEQATYAGLLLDTLIGDHSIATYTSHFVRARQTLECITNIVGDRVKFSRIDPEMRELKWASNDFTSTLDQAGQDRLKDHMESFYNANPGGESAAQGFARMPGVIKDMYTDFQRPDFPENVIMVSHGITMRLFLMCLLKLPTSMYDILENPRNCHIFHLRLNKLGEYDLVTPLPKK